MTVNYTQSSTRTHTNTLLVVWLHTLPTLPVLLLALVIRI